MLGCAKTVRGSALVTTGSTHFRVVQGFTHTPTSSQNLVRVLSPQIDRALLARKRREIKYRFRQTNYGGRSIIVYHTGPLTTPHLPPISGDMQFPQAKYEWRLARKQSEIEYRFTQTNYACYGGLSLGTVTSDPPPVPPVLQTLQSNPTQTCMAMDS